MALALVFGVVWVGAKAPAHAPQIIVEPIERLFIDALDSRDNHVEPVAEVPETDTRASVSDGWCPDVVNAAYALGWQKDDLDELDYVTWKESRCDPSAYYAKDPNGGSHGVMQINGFWCRPSKYYPFGYLQTHRYLATCDDLYNPLVNLLAALEIFNYSQETNGNGWQPWGLPKDFCGTSTLGGRCLLSWGGKGGG
jgi:hypothetical protein